MNSTSPQDVYTFCPRCGSDRFVFQAPTARVCHACGLKYYVNAKAALALIVTNEKNEIILAKRARDPQKGLYDLPGGFVDPMERAEDTAARELFEELGIRAHTFSYVCSEPNQYFYTGVTHFTLDLFFQVKIHSSDTIIPADDVADILWVTGETIPWDKIAFPSVVAGLKHFCKQP